MQPIAVQTARFELALFGTFRLSVDGADIALRGRKACALLAYLALAHSHRATRETIADLLWTDRGAEQARASLRQTLAELRAIPGIDDMLVIERTMLCLLEGAVISDLGRILAASARGDLVALSAALVPIEGGLLYSLGDVSPRFDEWLASERPAQVERVVASCLASVEGAGMTRPEEALAILRALDRIDPLNEGVARMGLRLDHAIGDSAALHRRYRRLADQLQSEFASPPSEATRTLYQQLSRARASSEALASAPAPAPVPASPASAAAPAGDELIPAVIVAPLQLLGETGLTQAQAEFCSDDMRVAISAMSGIRVLAADAADVARLVTGSTDSLALYLLAGTVRDPGGGAVATLQLSDARSRAIVWSASLRLGGAADPLESIVAKAVGALMPAIDRDLERVLRTSPQELGDERAMFTRARLAIRGAANLAETRAAVDALERLVADNPRHLGARLLLGRMYNTDFWQQLTGHDIAAMRERAAHHLEIAAGLAPERVDVRVRRAWVLLRQGAYDAARRDFDAALGLRQLDSDILDQCAFGLCHLGDLDRAATVMQQAFDLNPFAPSDYHADYAVIQALARRHEAAEEHFLVSGESGLLYDGVRIANFSAFAAPPPGAAGIEARFARKFVAAWQAGGAPGPRDVLDWIGHTLPLRLPEHRDLVTQGLKQRLPAFWPAA